MARSKTRDGLNVTTQAELIFEKHGFYPVEEGVVLKGGNNRLFSVRKEGKTGVIKLYFRHPSDTRDRQRHEWEFSEFLWKSGIRNIPEPLELQREDGWSFFSLIEGTRPLCIDRCDVEMAGEFVRKINQNRKSPGADALLTASEASFSVGEQVAGIQKRVDRLRAIEEISSLHGEVKAAVEKKVIPRFEQMRKSIEKNFIANEWIEVLAQDQRILSPSDFGFHNSLKKADGSIVFLDFEYAGWDDPVKCMSDFFCQPAIPVDQKYEEIFTRSVVDGLGLNEEIWRRFEALKPFYRFKWGCILLNEFLPDTRNRRAEAIGGITEEYLRTQWTKAQSYLMPESD